ncbi:MAG TPA: PAS domain S-box protein [Azospirillaceae bacterium]|nr:PAS domain S-box protein [Azospirillaceae bacterium]
MNGLLLQMLERTGEGIVLLRVDAAGEAVIVHVNQPLLTRTGFTREALLGRPPEMLLGDRADATAVAAVRAAARSGRAFRREFLIQPAAGAAYWTDVEGFHLGPDGRGGFHYGLVSRDATLRRQAEIRQIDSERLETALALANDGLWEWDGRTHAVWLSPRLLEMLGYAEGEAPADQSTWLKHCPPEDAASAFRIFDELLHNGRDNFDLVQRLIHRDGRTIYIHTRGRVLREQDGRIRRIVGLNTDISELVRTEEALRRAEARLQEAIDSISDAFMLIGPDRRMVTCNRRFRELYPDLAPHLRPGMSIEEMIGRAAEVRLFARGTEEASAWAADRLRLYESCDGVPFEQQLADGRWVRVIESRTKDGGTVSVRTDITAEKESERRLRESELRFRTLAESSPAGIFQIDLEGRALYVNTTLCRLAGLSPEDALGDGWRGSIHHEDRQALERLWRRAAQRQEGFRLNFRFGERWVSVLAAPQKNTEGELVGFIGTVIDIHEQRMAEAALRASERRYRRIIETAQEGIWVNDARGCAVYVNQRMAGMLGLAPEEMLGRHLSEFMDPDQAEVVNAKMENRRRGVSEQYDLRFRRKDGGSVWTLISTTPNADADGNFAGSLAMVIDITDRHRADEALARHVAELEASRRQLQQNAARLEELAERYVQEKLRAEESSLAKSRFLSSMSHELRTPLNSILGFSDILRKPDSGPADERLRSFADDIHAAGTYLLDLINDILDMSKIEAGKYELRLTAAATARLIEDTVRMVRQNAADRKLELAVRIDPGVPDRIRADARAIRQVLLNLLSNAMKFTPEGGRIAVTAQADGGMLEVAVSDTGIGIAAEDLPRLGKPFEQLDTALNRHHQGSGLGLALSKSLVEMHGGALSVASQPGLGTTVTVTLPVDGPK